MPVSRTKLVAGNWKMNAPLPDINEYAVVLKRLTAMVRKVDIVILPPTLYIEPLKRRLNGSKISLGVQNIYNSGLGAFTGEVSTDMLKSAGVTFCLAGHSERRQLFGETDAMVNQKVKAILGADITPILCFGETIEQRESGSTFNVLNGQLEGGLMGLTTDLVEKVVLAYEPVWAIGTGRTATVDQVSEVHAWVREWLVNHFNPETAEKMRIQYGGSVKASNAFELLHTPNVDGALVGGASLDPVSFADIIKASL